MRTKSFDNSPRTILQKRVSKDTIAQLKELMAQGKELGKAIGYKSEEEVAAEITAERRKTESWRQNIAAYRDRPS